MPINNPMAYVIDPTLRAKQAAGARAVSELQGLQQQPDYARALRDSATPLVPQGGSPTQYGYSGPTIMDLIANMATRGEGRKKLGALSTQAAALRDQAQAGTQAGMDIEEQIRQQGMQFKRDVDERASQNIRGPFKTYIGRRGNTITAAPTGGGAVDSLGRPVDLNDMRELRERGGLGRGSGGGTTGLKPTGTERKDYVESDRLVGVLDDLDGVYGGMDEDERKQADNAFTSFVTNQIPIQAVARMAENKFYDKEAVKKYLTRGARFESKLSQLMSGLAVSGFEMKDRQKWSPFAPGISQEDRQVRLDNIRDDLEGQIDAFETYYPDYTFEAISGARPSQRNAPQIGGDDSPGSRKLSLTEGELNATQEQQWLTEDELNATQEQLDKLYEAELKEHLGKIDLEAGGD